MLSQIIVSHPRPHTHMCRYWSELAPQLGHLQQAELEKVEFGLKIAYFAHDGQVSLFMLISMILVFTHLNDNK